jgi:hypothetical protein
MEVMDCGNKVCSTHRDYAPDLAAGSFLMEAGSSTLPGPMTGMDSVSDCLHLQDEVFSGG